MTGLDILAPEQRRESLDQQMLTMAQLRRAVLRDLAWLLNTTNLDPSGVLEGAPLASRSTLNYGISGLTGDDATDSRGAWVERAVTEAIKAFEPRIRPESLRVHARPLDREAGLPTLVLEISGELWAQPVPQQLFLETAIELDTRVTVVSESKGRG